MDPLGIAKSKTSISRHPARWFVACFAIAGLLAAPGCGLRRSSSPASTVVAGKPTSLAVGDNNQTIEFGGVERSYIVYRPAGVDGRTPAALVVMLHGGYGSDTQAESSYGWDAEADGNNFVVVYPNGINHAWNAGGGCCGQPAATNADDIGFITTVVSTVEHEIAIDPTRVFATGISNGGILSYDLACNTKVFAAIGPDSATVLGPCPSPSPISVIAIHGTADTRVPYNGGKGSNYSPQAPIDGPSIPAVNAQWRYVDRCSAPNDSTVGVVETSVAQCPEGREVELISISGAGHQWPGSVPKPVIEKLLGLDPPSTAINATQAIWTFFASHPMAHPS